MTSILRKRAAVAALLLAPWAALLVATPAAAEHRAPAYVDEDDAGGWRHPGAHGRHDDRYGPRHDDRYGPRHDGRRGRWDRRAPRITQVTPDDGEQLGDRRHTRVVARFDDRGSGIDVRSVRLILNGRDLTHLARVDEDHVRLRAAFTPGRHFAEVVVRDRAGNVSRRAWSFQVADPDWRRGYGYGYGYGQPAYRAPQRW